MWQNTASQPRSTARRDPSSTDEREGRYWDAVTARWLAERTGQGVVGSRPTRRDAPPSSRDPKRQPGDPSITD